MMDHRFDLSQPYHYQVTEEKHILALTGSMLPGAAVCDTHFYGSVYFIPAVCAVLFQPYLSFLCFPLSREISTNISDNITSRTGFVCADEMLHVTDIILSTDIGF
jgi:hypothetical protein